MKPGKLALLVAAVLSAVTGCTSVEYVSPAEGWYIPKATINVAPNTHYTLEQLALTGLAGLALNYVYQPFAPNWTLEEAVLDERTYYIRMQAKRFRIGGDGEAMMLLKRRATQLQYDRGYAGFRILDYAEGVESNTPIAQRFSQGIVQLVKVDAAAAR